MLINMFVLDTCLGSLTVELCYEGRIEAFYVHEANQQSKLIAGGLESVLKKVGRSIDEIKDIVVINGPGSFTGARIGMSFIQGLGFKDIYTCDSITMLWCEIGMPDGLVAINAGVKGFYGKKFKNKAPLDGKLLYIENNELIALYASQNLDIYMPRKDNTLLRKLATDEKFVGDWDQKTGVHSNAHEDLSSESTHKLPFALEFFNKSNEVKALEIIKYFKQHREFFHGPISIFDAKPIYI